MTDEREPGETRDPVESPDEMARQADVDETLEPGSEPGGPDWPTEATEGPGASEPLGPEHAAD